MSSFDDNNGTQKGISDVPEENLSVLEEIETPDSSKEVEIDIEPPREADKVISNQIEDYLNSDDDSNTDQTAPTEEELIVLKEENASGEDIESLEKTAKDLVEASDKEPEKETSAKTTEESDSQKKTESTTSKTSIEDKNILDQIDRTQEDFSYKTEEKHEEKKKSMPVWGWIAIAVVAIIAIFLIINFTGGTSGGGAGSTSSADLPGVWYSENREGYALLYQFNDNGTGTMALIDFASGQNQRYDFNYTADNGTMTVTLNDQSNSWDYRINGDTLTFEAQDATENFIKSDVDLDQTINGLIDGSIT